MMLHESSQKIRQELVSSTFVLVPSDTTPQTGFVVLADKRCHQTVDGTALSIVLLTDAQAVL